MNVKNEVRVIGWDDSPFKRTDSQSTCVGVIYRGGKFLDGILSTKVAIDGSDATRKIAGSINKSRHKGQLRIIMTDGITFGGFNYVNIKSLYEKTSLPVIAVVRKIPDMSKFMSAVSKIPGVKSRRKAVEDAGEFEQVQLPGGNVYFQCHGTDKNKASKIIKITCTQGLVPEPLRVAHLIAGGITKGESVGRA